MLNIIYKGKNVPCCHKLSSAVSLSRDQSRSRRKHALRYLAQDFPIQSNHSHTRWASSPFSIRNAANKQELINLRCSSSKGAAWSGSVGSGCSPARGPSCPSTGSQAGGSTAQCLSLPIWTLQCLRRSWRVRSRENHGLAGRLFLDYCPSRSPGVFDINTPNWQHKGSIWIA